VLGSDISDKVTIFISYLVDGGYKIIKYKKKIIILLLICITIKLDMFETIIKNYFFNCSLHLNIEILF
jgi:hypothetical protein